MRWPSRIAGSGPIRPARLHVGVLLLDAALFSALLLPKLLPVRPGRFLSNSPADGTIFLWSLGWWRHALPLGEVLPYTHALFAPQGANLAWTTSIPFPSLLVWPVSQTFGVFAAFNVLSLLAPITAAWTTYLLVHRLTRRWPASLGAGLLFALSPLEVTEVRMGHLNLSLTALVPLAVYLVVRQVEGSLPSGAFLVLLGVVLAAEFATSTEVLATTLLFGAVAFLFLAVFDRERRPALSRCARLVGLSCVVAAVLVSPILVTAFAKPHPAGLTSRIQAASLPVESAPLVRAIGPVAKTGPESASDRQSTPPDVLLVLPLLAILTHLVWTRRREPVVQALLITALIALACAAGASRSLPTPWGLLRHLPPLGLVSPQRLTMFAWLIGAAGVGAWLAERKGSWRRPCAALVALVALLPPVWSGVWTSAIRTPAFPVAARPYLSSGAIVVVVAGAPPVPAQLNDLAYPTVWQIQSDFSFRLANAYIGTLAPALPFSVGQFVYQRELLPGEAPAVLAWIRRIGARAVLVTRATPSTMEPVARLLGTDPIPVGDAALYPVPDGPG